MSHATSASGLEKKYLFIRSLRWIYDVDEMSSSKKRESRIHSRDLKEDGEV